MSNAFSARGLRRLGPWLLVLAVPLAAGWLIWQVTKLTARALGRLLVLAGIAVPALTTGRHRRSAAPLWVALAAQVSVPVPGAPWAWISTAGALMYLGTRRPGAGLSELSGPDDVDLDAVALEDGGRRWLSARELRIAGRTFAGIALVLVIGLPWVVAAAALSAVVLTGAIAWWRDVAADPVVLSAFETAWYEKVANPHPQAESRYPALEGWFREWDDENGRGIYELAHTDAWAVSGMDAKVELAFDQRPGTISLAADPRLSRRLLRITASDPSVGGRLRMFDGYSLARDGRFIVGYDKGGAPVYGRLWGPDGALYITIIAPPNMGKGSLLRLIGVEGAAYPDLEMFGCCGKRGAGLGYLRQAFHTLTTNHTDSADLVHGYLEAVRERVERYGQAGEDGYMVRDQDPRLLLVIDEPKWIMAHEPRVAGWLREISGTSRSVGAGLVITLHKGDGPGYGDTETRSNMITNGWRAIGPAPDTQAKNTALQGDDFDPSTLPKQPGWFGLVGGPLEAPPAPVRTLWVPNDYDIKRGLDMDVTGMKTELDVAPFGTVQQWVDRDVVHPDIHPATLEALFRPTRERAERAAQAEQAASEAGEQAAAEGPAPTDGWARIQEALRANPDGLLRFQIAAAAGLSPGHTSQLLSDRRQHGDVIQTTSKLWRLAA